MNEIKGKIVNDSIVPNFVLWLYATIVLFPISVYLMYLIFSYKSLVPLFVTFLMTMGSLSIGIFGPVHLSFANRITRFSGRDLFIEERGQTITLVKDKNIQVTWDDILAWRDSHHLTDVTGIQRRCIDLVIVVDGKPKLYRTSSDNKSVYKKPGRSFNRPDYSFHNDKQIFFDEYKERLKPLLDTVPQDHELIDKLRYSNTKKGDILRIIGLVLILGSFIVGFAGMASGIGLPALALGFPAGLYALNESKKYFKDVSR